MKRTTTTLITLAVFATTGFGQFGGADGKDPFAVEEERLPSLQKPASSENTPDTFSVIQKIGLLLEWIELGSPEANQLLREHAAKTEGPALRTALDALIEDGTAVVLATNYAKTISGNRVTASSGESVIYPTEWEPPQIGPAPAEAGNRQVTAVISPSTPTSFDTRDLGPTLEAEANLSTTNGVIDARISAKWSVFEGRDYQAHEKSPGRGIADIWQPRFHHLVTSAAVTLTDGTPSLVSALKSREAGKTVLLVLQANVLESIVPDKE